MKRVNYDQIAPEYDERFPADLGGKDRSQALHALAEALQPRRILEAGCGTAHWLSGLHSANRQLVGLDFSMGMLRQAKKHTAPLELVHGSADRLPFADQSFDLVYCVDAIHHFSDPQRFIARAFSLLAPGGILAVLGMDPHSHKDRWYAYEYFDGMYATDLQRFPSQESLCGWMLSAGFVDLAVQEVERVEAPRLGRAVLDDPFLKRNSCSQMALLSDESYQLGLERIQAALEQAERGGGKLAFPSLICIDMVTGRKRER